jgi:hypothetical protein
MRMAFLSEAMTLRIEGIWLVKETGVLAENLPACGAAGELQQRTHRESCHTIAKCARGADVRRTSTGRTTAQKPLKYSGLLPQQRPHRAEFVRPASGWPGIPLTETTMSSAPFHASLIANLRHRRRLTFRAMAGLTGIPKSSLFDLEVGRRRPTDDEWRGMSLLLDALLEPEDRIVGLTCYPPRPKVESRLGQRLAAALNQADRAVVVYPTLHPWLAVSRVVREAVSHHDLPFVDRVVEQALKRLKSGGRLVFPVPVGVMNRLFSREAEFTAVPKSTLRRQLGHLLDTVIDEFNVSMPAVDSSAHATFHALNAQVRTTVLIDDTTLVRVLMNGSIQWVDGGASNEAGQFVAHVGAQVDTLLASAIDPNGQAVIYGAYDRLFGGRRCEVSR